MLEAGKSLESFATHLSLETGEEGWEEDDRKVALDLQCGPG